jgi:quercetin dioxygenase-like cupin family protein
MILLPSESQVVGLADQVLFQLDKRLIPKGAALASLIINSKEECQNTLFRVVFDAGSMSEWHSHPRGQILVIVRGECTTEFHDASPTVSGVGSIVWIEPNVVHRHGSGSEEMEYVSMQQILNGTATNWK